MLAQYAAQYSEPFRIQLAGTLLSIPPLVAPQREFISGRTSGAIQA